LRTNSSTTCATSPLMAALPVNGIFRRPSHPAPLVVRPLFPSAIRSAVGNGGDERIRALPEQPQELIVADPDAFTKPLAPFPELSLGDQHRDKRPIGGNGSFPPKPDGFSDRYLHPTLAKSERDRLTMLWYYTRDIQNVRALSIISCFHLKLIHIYRTKYSSPIYKTLSTSCTNSWAWSVPSLALWTAITSGDLSPTVSHSPSSLGAKAHARTRLTSRQAASSPSPI
jgi:hypothetical protein